MQAADSFHLGQNLGQAAEKTVNAHRAQLGEPAAGRARSRWRWCSQRREEGRHPNAHVLRRSPATTGPGLSKATISRKLGLHPATVRKFASARSVDDLIAKTDQRAHLVDPYNGHLHRRWHEGERNATQLFR